MNPVSKADTKPPRRISAEDMPVLTIAMDAGFPLLGPFNRAFKAATGLTPTGFRRLALAKAPSKPPSETRSFEIDEPR